MPEYEYVCIECGEAFVVFFSLKELEAKPTVKCPQCQSDQVKKQITSFFAKTSKKSQIIAIAIKAENHWRQLFITAVKTACFFCKLTPVDNRFCRNYSRESCYTK